MNHEVRVKLCGACNKEFSDCPCEPSECALLEAMENAVIVVRCRDCKHYEWNPFDGCEVCTHISGYVRPDFGCVDGERKDNGI